MEEYEIRLQCLEMAMHTIGHGTGDPKKVIETAEKFYTWVNRTEEVSAPPQLRQAMQS